MTRFLVLADEFLELRVRLDRGDRPERRLAAGRRRLVGARSAEAGKFPRGVVEPATGVTHARHLLIFVRGHRIGGRHEVRLVLSHRHRASRGEQQQEQQRGHRHRSGPKGGCQSERHLARSLGTLAPSRRTISVESDVCARNDARGVYTRDATAFSTRATIGASWCNRGCGCGGLENALLAPRSAVELFRK